MKYSEQVGWYLQLNGKYGEIKYLRELGTIEIKKITSIYNEIMLSYPLEWLILLEIYELIVDSKFELKDKLREDLFELRKIDKYTDLIDNGLKLIK